MDPARKGPHRRLFSKYFLLLFIAVAVPLLISGVSDAWFSYRDQRALLESRLRIEASAAASRIENFVEEIGKQLSWTVRYAWTPDVQDQHFFDAASLLRQVPAVVSLTLVDGDAIERLHFSRLDLNRVDSGADLSRDPAVLRARTSGVWYGPMEYRHESEPHMTIAVAGNRRAVGIAIADVNLKVIWDVISSIRIGHGGKAFILDQPGRLIAHPDISLVLRGADDRTLAAMRRVRQAIDSAEGNVVVTENVHGEKVVAAMATVKGLDWLVFAEQPLSEAFAPIFSSLWRTAALLLAGAALAVALSYWLANRIVGPIRLLESGTERIGAGDFDHRIDMTTGDEFEQLAGRFNEMAEGLALSQERSERIARLRRFLAPQVAELVEKSGDEAVLAGQRAEVVVVFCDLRGFTAFSAKTGPDRVMQVLSDYFDALGAVVTRYEGTLTNFSGDGLMVLINAPVPCAEPALRAVEMAISMQRAVQALVAQWRADGDEVGFGIGLAMGPATVGRIGYEGRIEYTAIGSVVNLASRLCALATDGQILVEPAVSEAVQDRLRLKALGEQQVKGYSQPLAVFQVEFPLSEAPRPVAEAAPPQETASQIHQPD